MGKEESTSLVASDALGAVAGYGAIAPSSESIESMGDAQTRTDTTANALGWTGRGMIGVSLVGFIISASGVVGWPVAAATFGFMVTGAGLCVASEIKKECSRPKEAKPFHVHAKHEVNAGASDVEAPAVVG